MLIFLKRHPSNVLDVAIVLSIKGKRAVLHQKKKETLSPTPRKVSAKNSLGKQSCLARTTRIRLEG